MTSDARDMNKPKPGAALARAWADEIDRLANEREVHGLVAPGGWGTVAVALDRVLSRRRDTEEDYEAIERLVTEVVTEARGPASAVALWLRTAA